MRFVKTVAAAGLLGLIGLVVSPAMASSGGMLSSTAGKSIATASGDTGVVEVRKRHGKWKKYRKRHRSHRYWYNYDGYYGGGWGPYGGYYSDYYYYPYYPRYRVYVGPRHRGWWRYGHRRHGGISIGIGF